MKESTIHLNILNPLKYMFMGFLKHYINILIVQHLELGLPLLCAPCRQECQSTRRCLHGLSWHAWQTVWPVNPGLGTVACPPVTPASSSHGREGHHLPAKAKPKSNTSNKFSLFHKI